MTVSSFDPTKSPAWSRLRRISREVQQADTTEHVNSPASPTRSLMEVDGLVFDWSHQLIDDRAFAALVDLANELNVEERFQDQLSGGIVNTTENRPALHTALRGTNASLDPSVASSISNQQTEFLDFSESVRTGTSRGFHDQPFTDVLHVGIGGSHLGPKFLCRALQGDGPRIHFLSNTDPINAKETLTPLPAETTLIIVASKSFSTPETLKNLATVDAWFCETMPEQARQEHFVYVTSNQSEVTGMQGKSFLLHESIGGRFSVWSAVGLPLALSIGKREFQSFLDGGQYLDDRVMKSAPENNPGLILALMTIWNTNFLGTVSHVMATYDHRLRSFMSFIQQLEMESLGKSIGTDGQPTSTHTIPLVWGGEETNGQHSWHQWLHQGTRSFSADFIAVAPELEDADRNWMFANCLAQRELLFSGDAHHGHESYRQINGKHGSNLIVLSKVDAKNLGTLIAAYEHKVAYLSVLWGINAYDQWGVERGKKLAEDMYARLQSGESNPALGSVEELLCILQNRIRS